MAVEHVDIADGERHEPKGASTALAGSVYVSDGAASGAWTRVPEIITLVIPDQTSTTPVYVAMPFPGIVVAIYSIIDGAITTANETLTASINTTAITGGVITIIQSGSAAGNINTATPSADNTFMAGDYIKVASSGSSATARKVTVTLYVTRST